MKKSITPDYGKELDKQFKAVGKLKIKIAESMLAFSKQMGFTNVRVRMEQEYDRGEYYNTFKILSLRDDSEELLNIDMDFGTYNDDFGRAFEEVEALEVPNSAKFITDKKNYDLLDKDEVEDIDLGRLAVYFLKKGIKYEEAAVFFNCLFQDPDCLPQDWYQPTD